MIIHIDTQGMGDKEKTVILLTEISKYIKIPHKKRKAKQIREDNRRYERQRKK